ncbi:MAG: hypothetical protein HYU64_19015 [Armatimonadetes bacterium]|nr:hypothetical protein [Armatimonadota bacterium]
MNTIASALPGYRNINQQAAPPEEAKEKSFGAKVLAAPRAVVETVAGTVGGAASAVFHMPIGTVVGIAEGVTAPKGVSPQNISDMKTAGEYKGTGWYTTMSLLESTAIGAGVGAIAGNPLIGAGVGLAVGIIGRLVAGHADVPELFVIEVDKAVDQAVANNTEGTKVKIMVQSATEGAIIGTGRGVTEGWSIGWDAGKGAVSGVLDVAEGIVEGLKEAIFGK